MHRPSVPPSFQFCWENPTSCPLSCPAGSAVSVSYLDDFPDDPAFLSKRLQIFQFSKRFQEQTELLAAKNQVSWTSRRISVTLLLKIFSLLFVQMEITYLVHLCEGPQFLRTSCEVQSCLRAFLCVAHPFLKHPAFCVTEVEGVLCVQLEKITLLLRDFDAVDMQFDFFSHASRKFLLPIHAGRNMYTRKRHNCVCLIVLLPCWCCESGRP